MEEDEFGCDICGKHPDEAACAEADRRDHAKGADAPRHAPMLQAVDQGIDDRSDEEREQKGDEVLQETGAASKSAKNDAAATPIRRRALGRIPCSPQKAMQKVDDHPGEHETVKPVEDPSVSGYEAS